jgi:hypothetical protein
MNCFNIREIQAILKRKFFVDLINTHDYHVLLNKTAVGSRFKLNNSESISGNTLLFYKYGLELMPKIRNNIYFSNFSLFEEPAVLKMQSFPFLLTNYFATNYKFPKLYNFSTFFNSITFFGESVFANSTALTLFFFNNQFFSIDFLENFFKNSSKNMKSSLQILFKKISDFLITAFRTTSSAFYQFLQFCDFLTELTREYFNNFDYDKFSVYMRRLPIYLTELIRITYGYF